MNKCTGRSKLHLSLEVPVLLHARPWGLRRRQPGPTGSQSAGGVHNYVLPLYTPGLQLQVGFPEKKNWIRIQPLRKKQPDPELDKQPSPDPT